MLSFQPLELALRLTPAKARNAPMADSGGHIAWKVAHRVSGTNPARVLLNNQATDRLTDDLLEPAWPFGLGSCPKVDHDADDADRVPEGAQRSWGRAHSATGLDPERPSSNISDSHDGERQPPVVIAARRASRSKTANTFQLGAKDSAGTQMRGANNGYPRNRRPYNSFR